MTNDARQIIYKYPLALETTQVLQLPKSSQILSVGLQRRPDNRTNGIYLWALIPLLPSPLIDFTIEIIGTGHYVAPLTDRRFIGTVFEDVYVWHVFERLT